MLKLDKTEYDLNTLFSFEVLKEILLKLARSQTKIEKEMYQIKNKDLKRIERVVQDSLGPIEVTEENNEDENEEENENDYFQNEKNENENELGDNKNKSNEKEINRDKNKDNDAGNKNFNFPENKNIDNYDKSSNNDKNNLIINSNNHEIINEEKKEKSNELTKDNETNIKTDEKDTEVNNGKDQNVISNEKNMNYITNKSSKNPPKYRGGDVSEELSKLMKLINAQNKRISALEDKLKSESKNIKNAEAKLKNHSISNDSQFNLINEKINELFHNNKDYDKKIEDLQVKTSDFDIFSMFKDNGDGTIDATKVMVKALEEKVFKKFEIQDKRYKIESLDNMKTKNNVENIMPKIDQIHREIERIREIGNQQQEELDNNKRENNEQNYEIKNVIINELKQKMNQLNEELEKRINNKLQSLEQKMKISSDNKNEDNNFDLLKLNLGNDVNQEAINALDKKINDLRKKINDLDNTFRLYMNKMEIEPLKNELKDMKLILENKITKDDLKELYNFHLNTVDQMNDLKDFEEQSYDELKKNIKELKNLQQRIEILNGNVALLQNSPKKGGGPLIDFSKFVDQQKLTETLKPFLNQFEKIYREIDSIRRDMSLIEEDNMKMIRNAINNLDSEVNNRINDLKNYTQKKYVDKTEFNKAIRLLEVEIVELKDDNKKDADTWLLAKKPLKCFNCATCEANIKNEYSSADYLPWKKYPRGEKIHRMGEGFSHMLHMMTSEFVKSIEKNELSQDYNISSRNYNTNNNISTQFNEKSTGAFIINNREQLNEKGGFTLNNKELFREEFAKNLKKFTKMRLPKVRQYSNTKTIFKMDDNLPVSEDEINYNETVTNENNTKPNHSPKILKISKKQKSTLLGKDLNDIYGNIMSSKGFPIKRDFDFNKKTIKTEKSSDVNGNNFKN